ncbi:MAG: serine/threonine protein kinase [Rhodocyclaceae bacterium]|nr:serine/threonine protein kinase [Rhodocyclaceae bacterium]
MATQKNTPLPPDFQLEEYRIVRQLSSGGFSLVYLAEDAEGEIVAIKEYLPNSLALRSEGQTAPQIPQEHYSTFMYGMKCFFEEGHSLARIVHPNVVRVLNFFRANGTVYMVMTYEEGLTLAQYIRYRRNAKRPPSERLIRAIFARLLDGLREVHINRLLHLDIKPSNIYLRQDGSPVLLDFGAARQTLYAERPYLKPMFTPGYAPPEHFRGKKLGPWTDIYGIGASMHACVTGRAPQRAEKRLEEDRLLPLVDSEHAQRYSHELLAAIDACLRIEPEERPASVPLLQKVLREKSRPPAEPDDGRMADESADAYERETGREYQGEHEYEYENRYDELDEEEIPTSEQSTLA